MIRASIKGKDGKDVMVIGLSFANLDKFRALPGDTFIEIDGKELGLACNVLIFSGETEAHLADSMTQLIGPKTRIEVRGKLKH